MKATSILLSALLLLLAGVAFATPSPELPANTLYQKIATDDGLNGAAVYGQRPTNQLEEIVGDTLVVGMTWRDMQHNSAVGRMIAVDDPENGGSQLVQFAYTYRATPTATSYVYTREGYMAYDGTMTWSTNPTQVSTSWWSAYTVVEMSATNEDVLMTYHGNDDYTSYHAAPNPFVPNLFNQYAIPEVAVVTMWPHGAGGMYNSDYQLHTILNEYDPDNLLEDGLYYHRATYEDTGAIFTTTTPGGSDQALITDIAMNLSGSVAVSPNGEHVAIAQTIGRFNTLGEGDQSTQFNNDVYIWESTDGGDNWNWGVNNAFNVTDFLPPDPNALPDTTTANQDTMRAYCETDMVYDADNTLHVVFTVAGYFFYEGTITYTSRIYYWNSVDQYVTLVADGNFFNFAYPAVWERIVCNPSITWDMENDLLWVAWVQYGEEGDNNGQYGYDCSDEGYAASDIYISASPNNGKHWTKGVNITNTRNMGTNLLPYATQSEREMSLAPDEGGDFLHLTYTNDFDPGVACPGGTDPIGDATDNEVIYHRIGKQELIDLFESNAEWLVNYPMHVDSSGFFQSADDWEWNGFWNPDGGGNPYADLELTGINTTVGANGGNVTYSAHLETYVNQSFQNVNYWTMVTLPNGSDYGPVSQISVNIPAMANITVPQMSLSVPAMAPAGNYTFYGHLGYYPNSIIHDSFPFNKLATGVGGEDYEFDPVDWKSSTPWPDLMAAETEGVDLPSAYELVGVYPNPFNAATTIHITLPETAELNVSVFNITGQQVATVANSTFNAGEHRLTFDASTLASGLYFVRAEVPCELNAVQKVMLVR